MIVEKFYFLGFVVALDINFFVGVCDNRQQIAGGLKNLKSFAHAD